MNTHIPLETLSNWLEDEHSGNHSPQHLLTGLHIHHCPTCTQRLEALQRLERVTNDLVTEEENKQASDSSWLDTMLSNLVLETKAGRSIPLTAHHELDTLTQTEGSVIAAIRRAGESLPGALVSRCRLDGDVEAPRAPINVEITASVREGSSVADITRELRERVRKELERISELNVEQINITVEDMHSFDIEQATKNLKDSPHAP